MRNWALLLALASITTTGCANRTGLADVPVITKMPPRAVVSLADVVNNMKCDMQEFLRGNKIITKTAMDIGGTFTFTLDRANASQAGVKVGIPIATGIKVDANAGRSNTLSFGETVVAPFLFHFDSKSPPAPCPVPLNVTNANGAPDVGLLRQPILNLTALKAELVRVIQGEPKIAFGDFQFSGSIAFVRETTAGAAINVVIINPSISDKISADYKVDYKIGTNWKHILEEAKFSMDDPATIPTILEPKLEGTKSQPVPKGESAKKPGADNKAPPKRPNATRWLKGCVSRELAKQLGIKPSCPRRRPKRK